jgi:hypothetical protein
MQRSTMLLSSVNHLFLWAIYTMARLVITRDPPPPSPPGVKGIRHPALAPTPVLLPDLRRMRQGTVAQIGEVPGTWHVYWKTHQKWMEPWDLPSSKLTWRPWHESGLKMVERSISTINWWFSGSMIIYQGVTIKNEGKLWFHQQKWWYMMVKW